MSEFSLVDLYAQRQAVLGYVQDWSQDDILDWMRRYGTIATIPTNYNTTLYRFDSNSGSKAAFYFSDTGSLIIMPPR